MKLMFLFWGMAMSMIASATSVESINFYQVNIDQAKELAAEQGKLVMVDFYANWCAPCKWMEESTFADPEVVSIINNHFIPVKIDIDQIDGYSMKQQYSVRYLPTIIIFDENGRVLSRVEETLSASKMSEFLTSHLEGKPNMNLVKKINVSPKNTAHTFSPKDEKSLYRVQVGSFSEFKNTYKVVNSLKDQFLEPVIVLNDYRNEKTYYNVMIGEFKTKREADGFATILKEEFNIPAIVK